MELREDVAHGTWDYPFQVHFTALDDGLSLYPHMHDELEITCITKGEGIFCINGHDYDVHPGSILIIPSGGIHLATQTRIEPAGFFSIVFSPTVFSPSSEGRIHTKYIAPILDGRLVFLEYLDGTLSWHKDVWTVAKEIEAASLITDQELLCQSALLKLWFLLWEHSIPKEADDGSDLRWVRLKESIDYMHKHFEQHIRISELASIAHMSEGHFSRTFKEYMKLSPIDYLIQIRIHESAKLLKKSDLPIGEIALRCGFNDFSYFGKHFKKEMKCSPRAYRK